MKGSRRAHEMKGNIYSTLAICSGSAASVYRYSTLASWASDIDGEESVCRRIRGQILHLLTY